MNDDFSNFKSAICWPKLEESLTIDTDGFRHIGVGLYQAIDNAAKAFVIAPNTESPIEVQFGGYLAGTLSRTLKEVGIEFEIGDPKPRLRPTVFLCPQYVVGKFRYDFALVVNGKAAVLIECDGKDFHSSDEAIANDRAKDLKAAEIGAVIRRYTGSQIFRDLKECANDAIAALSQWRP